MNTTTWLVLLAATLLAGMFLCRRRIARFVSGWNSLKTFVLIALIGAVIAGSISFSLWPAEIKTRITEGWTRWGNPTVDYSFVAGAIFVIVVLAIAWKISRRWVFAPLLALGSLATLAYFHPEEMASLVINIGFVLLTLVVLGLLGWASWENRASWFGGASPLWKWLGKIVTGLIALGMILHLVQYGSTHGWNIYTNSLMIVAVILAAFVVFSDTKKSLAVAGLMLFMIGVGGYTVEDLFKKSRDGFAWVKEAPGRFAAYTEELAKQQQAARSATSPAASKSKADAEETPRTFHSLLTGEKPTKSKLVDGVPGDTPDTARTRRLNQNQAALVPASYREETVTLTRQEGRIRLPGKCTGPKSGSVWVTLHPRGPSEPPHKELINSSQAPYYFRNLGNQNLNSQYQGDQYRHYLLPQGVDEVKLVIREC